MAKNETKDMSATANSPINKDMFNKMANDADCKIIADYINDYFKTSDGNPLFMSPTFSDVEINGFCWKEFDVTADLDIQALFFKLRTSKKTIHFTFLKSCAPHIIGGRSLPLSVEDRLVFLGKGIMKYLYN